jgi:2-oxoisovalerate dehydrogenase E1 component alpha subunit
MEGNTLKRTSTKSGAKARPRPEVLAGAVRRAQKGTNKAEAPARDKGLDGRPQTGTPVVSKGTQRKFTLEPKLLLQMHDLMVKARVLEERLIRMYKQSQGYFWLGGPGEEAFNVSLGLQINKGQGLAHDFMHFHYRQSATMLAMGMDPMDAMRQMQNTATDPFSGGRNFCSHYSKRDWNVVPVTSTIETQYLTSIGSGIAHRRAGKTQKSKGITIVTGGDAGTAEGDFASCLVWASRPGFELPMLIIVTNNQFGISTSYGTQHGEQNVADRGKAFGIKTKTIDGKDVESAWYALQEAMEYVRTERKPFLLEARVSRLYGHSSATGANLITNEEDPLVTFESQLEAAGIITRPEMEAIREKYTAEMLEMSKRVKEEPMPDPSTIYDHIYCGQKGRYW